VAKESLEIKYFLLPFLYSLFYKHTLQVLYIQCFNIT
jgi:hypothetical protein